MKVAGLVRKIESARETLCKSVQVETLKLDGGGGMCACSMVAPTSRQVRVETSYTMDLRHWQDTVDTYISRQKPSSRNHLLDQL